MANSLVGVARDMIAVNLADLIDPTDPQNRTYREVNRAKTHNIPLGSLVEIVETGVRLFVAYLGRDCDQTPLYWLSIELEHEPRIGGYAEESLKVIK